MSTSNTQKTLKWLKDQGLKTGIVERWNPHRRIRQDLFGFIDILALDPVLGVIGVQSTGSAFSEHYKKITIECRDAARDWLETPGTCLLLVGWRKIKVKRGGKAMVWAPRIKEITLTDLENTNANLS